MSCVFQFRRETLRKVEHAEDWHASNRALECASFLFFWFALARFCFSVGSVRLCLVFGVSSDGFLCREALRNVEHAEDENSNN